MNKYLIELLKIQNTVILPGLGALMIANSKSGKVVFNPLLKFNDGALAKFISEKDGVDVQNAQNQVAKFVREVEAELAKGNSFDIFQFGKFQKKSDGTIDFIHEGTIEVAKSEEKKTSGVKQETKVESTVTKKADQEVVKPKDDLAEKLKSAEGTEKKDAKKEDTVSKKAKNVFIPDEKKTVESTEQKQKPSEISPKIPVAEGSKKDPQAQEKNSFKPKEETQSASNDSVKQGTDKKGAENKEDTPKKETVKEKFKKDKPQKVKHQNPEDKKPKKKKKLLPWILLIVIVGGGGFAGWWFRNEIDGFLHLGIGDKTKDSTHVPVDSTKQNLAVNDSLSAEMDTNENDTTNVDAEVVEEVVEEVKVEETKPVKNNTTSSSNYSSGGNYHIIGNAFSSEKNAENYVAKMKEKGYNAQNVGKYNGLYLISLKSFSSKEEAKNNLSSVKADADGAYVFRKK